MVVLNKCVLNNFSYNKENFASHCRANYIQIQLLQINIQIMEYLVFFISNGRKMKNSEIKILKNYLINIYKLGESNFKLSNNMDYYDFS